MTSSVTSSTRRTSTKQVLGILETKRRGQLSKTGGKKGRKGQEKGGKGDIRVCWMCGKTEHIAANCTKGSCNKSLNAVQEDKGDTSEEVHEDEDELHAWCLLEESENE